MVGLAVTCWPYNGRAASQHDKHSKVGGVGLLQMYDALNLSMSAAALMSHRALCCIASLHGFMPYTLPIPHLSRPIFSTTVAAMGCAASAQTEYVVCRMLRHMCTLSLHLSSLLFHAHKLATLGTRICAIFFTCQQC